MDELPLTRIDFTCDYPGCSLLSFAEVFPDLGKGGFGHWSYLCLLHFIKEQWIRKLDLGWTLAAWLYKLPFVNWLWEFYVKHSYFNSKGE